MYHSGFLIVTVPLKYAAEAVANHLLAASKHVRKKLYVKLEPSCGSLWPSPKSDLANLKTLSYFLPKFYDNVSRICSHLDVRLVLRAPEDFKSGSNHRQYSQIDILFTDSSDSDLNVQKYTERQFNQTCLNLVRLSSFVTSEYNEETLDHSFARYDTVILGGTFDRLHNGHKVLLTAAVLRTCKKLVVGITDGPMLRRKFLWELIEPVEKRMSDVREFLTEIEPNIDYSIVPIYDPFGPSIENPDMDCIIVSSETKRGGNSVNAERLKRNMKPLDMVVIDLVPDPHPAIGDEAKFSSSNVRRSLLGTYLRMPCNRSADAVRIALIGAACSHNCPISVELQKLGACVVDCGAVFREVLQTDSEMQSHLVREIRGNPAMLETADDGLKLGYGLLKNKDKLKILSFYIWKKIQPSIEAQIQSSANKNIVVLKVPFFLLVEHLSNINQVWGVVASESQLVQQWMQQFDMPEEEASPLVAKELPNAKVIKSSHLILSLQGDATFVANQVHKAWKLLSTKCQLLQQI